MKNNIFKICCLFFLIIIAIENGQCIGTPAAVKVGDQYLLDATTMCEGLNFKYSYDEDQKEIVIDYNEIQLECNIGKNDYFRKTDYFTCAIVPRLRYNRVFIPAEMISKVFPVKISKVENTLLLSLKDDSKKVKFKILTLIDEKQAKLLYAQYEKAVSEANTQKLQKLLIQDPMLVYARMLEYNCNALDIIFSNRKEQKELIKLLLDAGINPNDKDVMFGRSPIMSALIMGHIDTSLIDLMLTYGLNLNITDECGKSTLHYAAQCPVPVVAPKYIKYLLGAGISVNVKNVYQATPLFDACMSGCYENVECLVKAGADVNIKNFSGETPLSTAKFGFREDDYKRVVELLKKAGAK